MQQLSQEQPQGKSAMGIAGFVIGLVALCTSFLPIINNFSAILAALGLIFSVIGIVACARGSRSGKGLAIAGVVICIVSFAVVLGTQSMYSKAVDDAFSGPSVTSTTQAGDAATSTTASTTVSNDSATQTEELSVGATATLSNGLSVTVESVTGGLANYNGEEFTSVTVTYVNGGSDTATFNGYDWKAQDAQGAQRNSTYAVGGDSADSSARLSYGTLAAGGSVTGVLEFDGQVSKLIYSPSAFDSKNDVTWVVA